MIIIGSYQSIDVRRYRVIILTIVICLIAHLASLSQSKTDSLLQQVEQSSDDSLTLCLLLDLSKEYQFTDISKSYTILEKVLKIAEAKKLLWAKASAYKMDGILEAIQGNFESAIIYDDLALNLFTQLNDSLSISLCYNNLGTNYSSLGKFDEAYFYHTQSYRIANATNDKLQRAVSLHNIASVFKELSQYDRALEYLNLSNQLSNEVNDLEGAPYNYHEIGDIYMRKHEYDSALIALKRSLFLVRKIKLSFNELEPIVLINIAKTYLHQSNKKSALGYYDSAAILYLKAGNQYGLAQVALGRGLVFMFEKNYTEAQKLIVKCAQEARHMNARTLEIDCYENLSKLFQEKGDFQKSLSYFQQYQQLKDSLFSQGMQAKLLQDQIHFETESKEKQILVLTKLQELRKNEIKKQKTIRDILAVVVALVLILLFTVYRSGQRRIRINKLLMEHQEEIKRRSLELEQLNEVKDKFFSIISHDLRSPINSLSGILDLMDQGDISSAEFSNLNKELRIQFNHTKTLINNLLDWTLLQMDKLKIQMEKIDLNALVDSNIKLLSSLHLKEVKIVNSVKPSTYALGDTNMINLVLRNLLTNAIKFSKAGDLIEVSSIAEGNSYIMAVKDKGVGIQPEVQKILFEKTSGYTTRGTANEKGTGLGLILCKEFVEKNGGRIWLESTPGAGSIFYFTIKKYS